MSRSRGYCFTLNNWTDDHLAWLMLLCDKSYLTYMVIGFEIGPKNGLPHLQGYMHFDNGKTMKTICNEVPNISLIEAKAKGDKFDRRYKYCMKDDDYWEYGERPSDPGVNVTTTKVIDAIKEGKTIDELYEIFPSYMIHHSSKVKAYYEYIKPKHKTKFYVMPAAMSMHENIQLLHEEFHDLGAIAAVTELSQLMAYENYNTVIYFSEYYDKIHTLYPYGAPITYKYGYQQNVVNCERFIVVTDHHKLYENYHKIKI